MPTARTVNRTTTSARLLGVALGLSMVLVLAVESAFAASLPCSLQLGRLPLAAEGAGWSVAVPLGAPVADCRLETTSPALTLVRSPQGDEAWLVFQPVATGPVAGLLEIASGADRPVRRTAVAGEVVTAAPDNLPPLLVVSADGAAPERRYLRVSGMPEPTGCTMDLTAAALGRPGNGGWQALDIMPAPGVAESGGQLVFGTDGLTVPVQYSVAEAVTVLARAVLPAGWRYTSLRPYGERMVGGRLQGRAAVIGRRDGVAVLRSFDLRYDARRQRRVLRQRFAAELPDHPGNGSVALRALRAGDARSGVRARQFRLLSLDGETAALWHPDAGLVGLERAFGLRATGVTAASRRHRNAVFALHRDAGGGGTFLRRWSAVADGGTVALTGRRAELPLEQRLGVRSLRGFALVARRDRANWPQTPARERLLLLAAADGGGKAELPLSLYTLTLDPDEPSRITGARRRYATRLRYTPGGPPATMAYARGRLSGGRGYPAQVQVGLPGLTARRHIDITGFGTRFSGSPLVPGATHSIGTVPVSLARPRFMGLTNTDGVSVMQRYFYTGQSTEILAQGVIEGEYGVALRPSRSLRHAWLLTSDPVGGREARHSLRLLSSGVDQATNLPPLADAGPDLVAGRQPLELRVNAVDPNGDPLAIRWSAPGVEFSDPHSQVTRAFFPVGETQVRVQVREAGGRYEAVDMLRVRRDNPSAVDEAPGLRTRITGLFPNPANPRLQVAFTTKQSGPVRVTVHDLAGRLVRVLVDEQRGVGAWDVAWDGEDAAGRPVASGVYLVRLVAAGTEDVRRGVIVR